MFLGLCNCDVIFQVFCALSKIIEHKVCKHLKIRPFKVQLRLVIGNYWFRHITVKIQDESLLIIQFGT
jgi:hypothetical protein